MIWFQFAYHYFISLAVQCLFAYILKTGWLRSSATMTVLTTSNTLSFSYFSHFLCLQFAGQIKSVCLCPTPICNVLSCSVYIGENCMHFKVPLVISEKSYTPLLKCNRVFDKARSIHSTAPKSIKCH